MRCREKADELLSKLLALFQNKGTDEFSGDITTDKEDNLYVTADLPDHEVLYGYLLTFGDNVEVLAPAYIQDGIRDKVCSILKKYET